MSEIKVDTLTGKTTAGDITVTSEGGAATQSLQQGLAKAWVNFDGTSATDPASLTGVRDSHNISSLLDNNTGNHTVNINNEMLNASYAVSVSSSSGGMSNTDTMINPYVWATGSVSVGSNTNSGAPTDRFYLNLAIHGDLA